MKSISHDLYRYDSNNNRESGQIKTPVKDLASALDALKQGDFQTRWDATTQLSVHGPEVLPFLLEMLGVAATDADLQWFIAKILGAYPQPEAILALANLLETATDDDVCAQAARSLGGMGVQAIASLIPILKDPQRSPMAISALAQINQPEVLPLLLEAFPTASVESQVLILDRIASHQDVQSSEVIRQGLADEHAEVCRAAIAAFASFPHESIESRVELIIPFLDDSRSRVPEATAHALGRLATESAAIALTQKCCDPLTIPSLQPILIQSLGWMRSNAALAGLTQLWDQLSQQTPVSEHFLKEILTSVAQFAGTEVQVDAAQQVLAWVRSPLLQGISSLKCHGILALGRLADRSLMSELINLLADPDYVVQLHVIAALKQLASEDAYLEIQRRAEVEGLNQNLTTGLAIALREW